MFGIGSTLYVLYILFCFTNHFWLKKNWVGVVYDLAVKAYIVALIVYLNYLVFFFLGII